ncbi:hypothetical protein ACS0TY_005716 [Phlomoides rotata]
MNKQDMLKIQTCALKVNIHCEGCAHKIKKTLQKVEGVYKVIMDGEQGKVTVSGNVDPMLLINKLEKGGKHAELWGPQKGSFPMVKNMQFENLKDVKGQKGGGQIPKQIQMQMQQMQMNQKKGGEEKFTGKDQKSVKFKLPEESDDEFDEDDDDFDDEFDEDDDEFDEGFAAHKAPSKGAPVGHGAPAKKAAEKGDFKVKNGGGKDGGKGKKGGGIDVFLKGILGKATAGKKDGGGKNGKKGEKNKKEEGKKSSKKGGVDGGGNGKGAAKNGGGKGKDGWSKKGGEDFDGGPKVESKQHGFNEMSGSHKGGGGGGRNMDFMGQMGGFPAVQGMPAMNGVGRGQGMGGQGNPYNPQYMAHMMMMNQQRENGHGSYNPNPMMNQQRENGYGAYNPMPYPRPHPGMGYGPPPQAAGYGPPPPGNDQFTHMFSDENTDSCSIM